MYFKSIIFYLFFSGSFISFAQNSISGKITEVNNTALEFANVILHNAETKAVITGVISNENGNFKLQDIANGKYYLEVSMLGFKTKISEAFQLNNSNKTLNFSLEEDSLDEVVINYKRPTIKQTAEKLIVDLEQSAMVNTNLQDVIKKVPGLIVNNGNVSYAGQSGIRILINGKTTDYMDMNTLLRDMPADNISKVELIQQPGAEFDAEGSGPILNIILKKNVKLGTHGNIKANVGYTEDFLYGTSASIASYKNKLNWQASAGYRQSSWREDLFITRTVEDDIYDQESIAPEDPESYRFGGGLDYYLNDANTIGFNGNWFMSDSDRTTKNRTTIISGNMSNSLLTNNSFDRERTNYNINPYYEYDNEKTKVNVDFNYVNYDDANVNNLFKTETSVIDYNNRRYFQDSKFEIFTYKGDFKRTVSDNFNYSFGAKLSDVNQESDLKSFTENASGNFEEDTDQSNLFKIDETIFATYAKMNLTLDKWTFSGGLRFEESNTKGTTVTQNETRERKISKLFPSASVSRKLTESLGANVSYSYRIRRPSYSTLNAFVTYYDSYAFEQGNPNLKPAFTNSYQFSLTYDEQPFFNISYRDTKDAIFQVLQQNDVSGEVARTTINLAQNRNLSFSFLYGPLDFIDNLDGYTGIQVNYNEFISENLTPQLDLQKWNFTWFWNLEYKLPLDINTELSGYYTNGGLEGQIEYGDMALLDFAISKKFLDNRLKVDLSWEEIINRPFRGTIDYDNIDARIKNAWVSNNIYLQLTYNFGSKFSKDKNRSNASQEELNRIDDNN